jgi:hypothetical protein
MYGFCSLFVEYRRIFWYLGYIAPKYKIKLILYFGISRGSEKNTESVSTATSLLGQDLKPENPEHDAGC